MKSRNGATDAYTTRHSDFIDEVLVKCPLCGGMAVVKTPGYPQQDREVYEDQVRFGCYHCGKAMRLRDKPQTLLFTNSQGKPVVARMLQGENSRTDPFFGFDLWLVQSCLEDEIWAYNEAHLQFLEEFIAEPLRSRPQQPAYQHNKSIGSRLPRWMTSAKNRDKVLRVMQVLRQRLKSPLR